MKSVQFALATLLVLAVPAFAQHREAAAGGHQAMPAHPPIPAHGPKEYTGTPHAAEPNRNYSDKAGHPNVPHVDNGKHLGGPRHGQP